MNGTANVTRAMTSAGRYYPAQTFIHRLAAEAKIIIITGWALAALFSDDIGTMLIMLAVAILAMYAAALPAVLLSGPLRATLPFAVLSLVFAAFTIPGHTLAVVIGGLRVTQEGLQTGVLYFLKIFVLVWGASWLTWTTSPLSIANGLAHLIMPLRHVGVPVAEVSLAIALVFRFIPILFSEGARVLKSMRGRGLSWENGSLKLRVRILAKAMVPLFVSTIRQADLMAETLEARGWRGITALNRERVPWQHWLVTVLALVAILLITGAGAAFSNLMFGLCARGFTKPEVLHCGHY
ncbi:MAG TPA: hypothetical protein DHD79_04505 [Firmicutes bacterium]|jgi:energy-coupling factor transport system permease protein|nr:hypothetical protein [Bacillota bacterium]HAW70352.1 hypothetical protein [Bacillota bacterium]HAZ21093.1 hypothetical protein [Bacillota bacterium]HBE05478.1 hypothetical protein [Bacillota bacterium]HBG45140.1 hypothetical protein [Bacillota bacterium]